MYGFAEVLIIELQQFSLALRLLFSEVPFALVFRWSKHPPDSLPTAQGESLTLPALPCTDFAELLIGDC